MARPGRRLHADAVREHDARAEQPLLNSELLGYGRDPLAPIKDAVTADGDVVVPLDANAFGFWLKAAFGEPTTTGSGPWTHEFRSGSWTLPSLAIETGMPEVPRYAMYSGCVLDQLSWQMQRAGLLTATARLVAQGEASAPPAAPARRPHRAEALRPLQRRDQPQRRAARQHRLGRDHLRQQPRPDRDHPRRRPHRRRRPVDRRAHRPDRGALRRPDAGDAGDQRRRPASSPSATRCPPARASPSPRTPSTCRGRGSRSPARRACRRPSTGRPRATARSAACAPSRSSTTSKDTDPCCD
jgi:hypothetical protein